jgi:hypothetical protein
LVLHEDIFLAAIAVFDGDVGEKITPDLNVEIDIWRTDGHIVGDRFGGV